MSLPASSRPGAVGALPCVDASAPMTALQRKDAATDRNMVRMTAFLLSQGWTERREGVFGVGPGDAEDEELSGADSSSEQLFAVDGSAASQAVA